MAAYIGFMRAQETDPRVLPWKSAKQERNSVRPVAARQIRIAASTATVPLSYICMPLRSPGRTWASLVTRASFTGVVKSWQFISRPAQWAMASLTLGWQ
ncbi:MAG: hypothetical protein AMJ81_13820 [Phycisphaerae bacterium SM23_33]|nr:MAG: hypothetical protein AMJ81_13820 [Phycisphaerae bacterium SM23_33]